VSHLHFDGGRDRDLAAGLGDHLPVSLIELRAMDVFIVRAHQPGFPHCFEIAGSVANDMAYDRHADLPGKCPVIGVWGRVQLESQQLIGGGKVLRL
jgi:hypothetical protein